MSNSTLRIVLTVVFSVAILFLWNHFMAKKVVQKPGKAPNARNTKSGATDNPAGRHGVAASQPHGAAASQATAGKKASGKAPVGPVAKDAEGHHTSVTWKAGKAEVTFTDLQAALRHVVLNEKRYKEIRRGKLEAIDLVQTTLGKGPWPLQAAFPDSDFEVPAQALYRLVKREGNGLTYEWTSKKVRIRKYYELDTKRPVMWLTVEVKNLSSRILDERLKMRLFAQKDMKRAAPGMTNPYPRIPTGLCQVNGKLERRSVGAIAGTQSSCSAAGCGMGSGAVRQIGQVNWIASDDRYFMTALVPWDQGAQRLCEVKLFEKDPSVIEAALIFPQVKIKPGGKKRHKFMVFLGAKDLKALESIKSKGGKDLELSDSIEFGWFKVLARPMLFLLQFFYLFVGNWGLAIILLTLVVKGLTFYWTHKSMVSMRNMQRLKPKMDALKKKYGDDKARLNQETMSLYKIHKVNPLGGCLPMLIQMPIWFALYRTLGNAQELYRSPFFGWITDLTAPDPYYILPIAMGISMFAQQAITPQPMEGTQAKMMKYFMPGMFTFMMLWLPAGLTLYIFVNTVLTMVHQWHMNRSDPMPSKEQAKKEAEDEIGRMGGGGEPKTGGPRGRGPKGKKGGGKEVEKSAGSTGSAGAGSRGGKKRRRKKKPTAV